MQGLSGFEREVLSSRRGRCCAPRTTASTCGPSHTSTSSGAANLYPDSSTSIDTTGTAENGPGGGGPPPARLGSAARAVTPADEEAATGT